MTTFDTAVTFDPRTLVEQDDPFTLAGKRGRWKKPIVVAPDGQTTEYERPSSLAKGLDTAGGLVRWGQGMAALGVVENPELAEQIKALPFDGDERAWKRPLYDIGEEAKENASVNRGANWGSLAHQLTAYHDRGITPPYDVPPEAQAILDAYVAEMERMNMRRPAELVERPVICDSIKAAGSADGWWERPACETCGGTLALGDIKSSRSISYLSWALQLAIYSLANALYDPKTETRLPLPENVCTCKAVVIWLQYTERDGKDSCSVLEVDLAQASEALLTLIEVEEFRRTQRQIVVARTRPYEAAAPKLTVRDRVQRILREADARGAADWRGHLANAWNNAGLPPLTGDLPTELEPLAVEVIAGFERRFDIGAEAISADDWSARIAKLPADLAKQAEPALMLYNVDHRDDTWTPLAAAEAADRIRDLETQHRARIELIRRHLAEAKSQLLERYTSGTDVAAMTARDAERCIALVCAERDGLIELADANFWRPIVDVKTWCSGTRGRRVVLDAAKPIAKRHNIVAPKKADDVVANAILLALVAAEIA